MKTLIKILIASVFILILLGAVLVFSASGTYSAIKFNNIYVLFKLHLWKVFSALAALIVFSVLPYENYKRFSKFFMIGIIVLLFLTLVFASEVKGASRWIDLGIFQFQPSELAKIILIIHLAKMIELKGKFIKDFKNGYVYLMFWILMVCGLVIAQPNVSTSVIIFIVSFVLLFIGGARIKHLAATAGTLLIVGGSIMMSLSHARERIMTFINTFGEGGESNIQVLQSKIALGSGGMFGVGIGHSRQSDLFLAESYSDFIFSILGEELGFIGTVAVLFTYLTIFTIGIIIAKKAPDRFGQLLAFGLAFNIVLSGFINAAVATGVIPTTGITLPFLSFGGTSIILFSISIGVIINIGLQTYKKRELIMAKA